MCKEQWYHKSQLTLKMSLQSWNKYNLVVLWIMIEYQIRCQGYFTE
jgi:hypothetical protein